MSLWTAGQALLVTALVMSATGAQALICDDLPRRLDGRGPGELRAVWRELDVRSALFAERAGPLQLVRHHLATPGARQGFIVLAITDGAGEDWQFLVFTRPAGGCRFIGAIDVAAQTGGPPAHRLVPLPDGQTAFVLRALARRGTDLELERETWHLLSGPRLTRILDYPVRGHMVGWPSTFDRSFRTRAEALRTGDAVDAVRVTFIASYTSGSYIHWMPVEPLFTTTRTAHYAWKRAQKRFLLDPVRSELYDDEIDGLFHDAEEQFLRHNVAELTRLAAQATGRQRVWLQHFLDSVPDGPEKRAVVESIR